VSARSKSRSSRVAAPVRFDAHVHLSRYWPDLAKNSYGPEVDFTVPGLLAEFDAAGIGSGLLLQLNDAPDVDATLHEGAAMARASAGRLLRTSTVDPTKGPAAIADAVARWEQTPDLVAIKLYPGYQRFYPHDPVLDPLYELAARRRLPVLFHQGDTLDPAGLVKFARPIEVDEVAVRFRELPIVLCHMGNPWFEEAAELVYKNPNVYADTSGLLWDPRLPRFDELVRRAQVRLAEALAEIGDVSKILYGSDWPLESIDLAVRFIDGLPLPKADRAQILGGNALRLFGKVRGTTSG
jgi:uncharacterized protein